jgi:hypothetical protein
MSGLRFGTRAASAILAATAALLALVALFVHLPGQASMDTSVQLYEASLGQSVSWNPPMMSALMRWLGGGERALAALVIVSSLCTYGALATVAGVGLSSRGAGERLLGWRVALALLVLANPVLLVFVGIVWKDVLFASLLVACVALSFLAASLPARGRLLLALFVAAVLGVAEQVRQQGMFMAPLLLALPVIALVQGRALPRARQLLLGVMVVAMFVLSLLASRALVERTIRGNEGASSSVGFRSIMNYDLVGMIVRSRTPTAELPVPVTEAQRAALAQAYSSYRIDYLGGSAAASAYLDGMDAPALRHAWTTMLRAEPGAYLAHRLSVFRALTDVDGVDNCLPVHIGIDGNSEYLRAAGVREGIDARDQALFDFVQHVRGWPLYRHWFYLLGLVVLVAATLKASLPAPFRGMLLVVGAAVGLFYLSFLPTAISCDFRYLYGAIPLLSTMCLLLLTAHAGPAGGSAHGR